MKTTRKIATITLIVLLTVIAYGLFRTYGSTTTPQLAPAGDNTARGPAIDQTPLHTAQRFAHMSTSADELPLAQEALRLGDREMDLAFAAGVRQAQDHPATLTAETKEIQTRLEYSENSLDRDTTRVTQLSAAVAKATGAEADRLDNELDQAKVQAELDQDEVDNAKQELVLAGGDTQGRIEELMREHDAASRIADSTTVNATTPPEVEGLVHLYVQWSALRDKALQLRDAKQDAVSAAFAFTTQRDALASIIKTQKQDSAGTLGKGPTPPPGASSAASGRGNSAELVSAARRRSNTVKELTSLDERVENQKRLAETYRRWIDVVAARQRSVVHSGLSGAAVIVAILLIGIFFNSWLKSLLSRVRLDQRQADTLHAVVRTGVQILALGLILLVIFGPPGQLGTFLGLAGAGLTVALKDFIVGFIGWFVLMGKNGIRLGDWVEINGVTGEVVELGMFHTVLLETGNWTDSGHPTGRRVTFTNSFAIEGHYFNFSTSGQWLWDELKLVLASSQDPYPIVDAIQKTVLEATAQSAAQAEKEWQHAAYSRDMSTLSAAPAVNVKPVIGGVEIAVRYITRASERSQMRSKLYEAAMNLISKKDGQEPRSGVPPK
jgi:small-conductance mechanosensitive channel